MLKPIYIAIYLVGRYWVDMRTTVIIRSELRCCGALFYNHGGFAFCKSFKSSKVIYLLCLSNARVGIPNQKMKEGSQFFLVSFYRVVSQSDGSCCFSTKFVRDFGQTSVATAAHLQMVRYQAVHDHPCV